MTAHIVTAPAPATGPTGTTTGTAPASGTAPAPAVIAPTPAAVAGAGLGGAWLPLSAAFTDAVADLTDREDLTVQCAPGLGQGAPGCFVPALATIELDGTHLGHRPDTCDPTRPADRHRYPILWGVLVHEAAHATHTRWEPPTGAPAAVFDAALALEESRIEAAQVRRRPADRSWLRAAASSLILADFFTPTTSTHTATAATAPATVPHGASGASATPATAPGSGAGASGTGSGASGAVASGTVAGAAVTTPGAAMTPWNAGRAAALLLARTDAGILTLAETAPLREVVVGVLGESRLSALSALWHIAHTTGDTDGEAMLELGRRWCRIIGARPDHPAPVPQPGTPGASGDPSPLVKAVGETLIAVHASSDTRATAPGTPGASSTAANKGEERRREKKAREEAQRAARRVFAPSTTPTTARRGPTAITSTRTPEPAEQAAARRLARQLRSAAHRDRVTTRTTSATPPGRLSMRGALAADAQRAAGTTPTAEPFTQTIRRHVPAPPLRIGIACDVSGSMNEFARPVASAAWIIARAAGHVPDAVSASVIFGAWVRALTHPGQTPAQVPVFAANDPCEDFTTAVDALDAALDLTRPGAARLLVVVSDGRFKDPHPTLGQQRLDRLTASGCAVLWLAPHSHATVLNGAHPITLTDPAQTADTIGAAATRALRNA
ncbi:VWA domain-containing protein [Actinomadura sp. LD22]|uniref:VWA domain-containing protein n=1 Tax=Actinomadura physcomitrii TaxID=2650748 RepID=A0A6I4MKL7_9ACTN|nr:VWA domain-containing protein [Actinomadura physcomitrii]MWA02766.1 VWA domain-containing protein [Actinomadura physcomitrii]